METEANRLASDLFNILPLHPIPLSEKLNLEFIGRALRGVRSKRSYQPSSVIDPGLPHFPRVGRD
jgi:hypothetical protein